MPLPQESPYFAGTKKQFMNRYRILAGIFCLLATGNVLAEEADTLKVVDVEEITVIATPKENRKLREQPTAVTLLSQQDMQNAQVNSIKNLTSVVPNIFIPDYGSRLTSAVYIRGIGSRTNTAKMAAARSPAYVGEPIWSNTTDNCSRSFPRRNIVLTKLLPNSE